MSYQVGEPPDVSEANHVAKGGEEEVAFVGPLASVELFFNQSFEGNNFVLDSLQFSGLESFYLTHNVCLNYRGLSKHIEREFPACPACLHD